MGTGTGYTGPGAVVQRRVRCASCDVGTMTDAPCQYCGTVNGDQVTRPSFVSECGLCGHTHMYFHRPGARWTCGQCHGYVQGFTLGGEVRWAPAPGGGLRALAEAVDGS